MVRRYFSGHAQYGDTKRKKIAKTNEETKGVIRDPITRYCCPNDL